MLAIAGLVATACPAKGQEQPAAQAPVSVESRVLPRITPGTTIGSQAPTGWTHLVFKARTRLASGDVDRLSTNAKSLVELLFTAMVARVRRVAGQPEATYRLEAVAVGMGTRIGDRDVIISGKTQKQLGADFNMAESFALSIGEQGLDRMQQIAASPTMLLVDAPTILYLDGANRDVVLRYCFLVDPASGSLASLVWPLKLGADEQYAGVEGSAVLIRSRLVATTPLHVDGDEFFIGFPSKRAVAAAKLPEGLAFDLPRNLRTIAGRQRFTPESASQLERQFREIVKFP
jgi:hypothetical protein